MVDVAIGGEGCLPQECVEALSLFGAHGGSPFGWNSPGSTQAGSPNVAAEISCLGAGHRQCCRQAGEEVSPDRGDSRPRNTAAPIFSG